MNRSRPAVPCGSEERQMVRKVSRLLVFGGIVSRASVAVGALLTMALDGCYSSWDIAPEIARVQLNGYHYPEPEPRMVVDVEGEPVPFETGTQLQLPQMPKPEKFSSIQVSGPAFTGTTYPGGQLFSADLRQLPMVHMRKFSLSKTIVVVAIPVGVVAIASTILTVALGSGPDR